VDFVILEVIDLFEIKIILFLGFSLHLYKKKNIYFILMYYRYYEEKNSQHMQLEPFLHLSNHTQI
jgi:hypothetical protein